MDGSRSIHKKQQAVLETLLQKAAHTDFGREHNFSGIDDYAHFSEQVPVQTYDDIQPAVEKLKNGAKNIFWPGEIDQFAVSAGTSGKGKHIPASAERIKSDRRFMRKVAISYFKQRPNLFRIVGTHLSMPGSVEKIDGNLIGEISGLTAINAPGWLRIFQIASPEKLTRLSFKKKFDLLLERSINANLKVITASPSWILTLFQQVLKTTGQQQIKEVWPNLNVLVCGGLKLANYRPHLQKLIGDKKVDFIETYGASEGYIGFNSDLSKEDLLMAVDNGLFFECVPNPLPPEKTSGVQEAIPLWEVETGEPYALRVTTNAGLWRYPLNDIIEFTEKNPLRFKVKGRVSEMLDDYSEAIYIYEAEKALNNAAEAYNLTIGTFAIAAVLKSEEDIPLHQWFVQFSKPVQADTLDKISKLIDEKLQVINRHYAIRRETNAMNEPEVYPITQSDINRWLEARGKQKAQAKLPKIIEKDTELLK